MIQKRLFFILIFIVPSSFVFSQKNTFEFSFAPHIKILNNHNFFDSGFNGSSFNLAYNINFKKSLFIKPSIEAGATGPGNFLGASFGLYKSFKQINHLSFSSGIKTIHGAFLFHQNNIYFFGFSSEAALNYKLKENFTSSAFLELRYYSAPNYKTFSPIYTYLDLLIGIRIIFNFKKRPKQSPL